VTAVITVAGVMRTGAGGVIGIAGEGDSLKGAD
jgi:hypothetical protein